MIARIPARPLTPTMGSRNSTRAGGGGAVAIDQRTRFRPDTVALGVGPREVQRLESAGPGLLEDAPKHLEPEVVRRKPVLRHGEVDRHEAWRRAGQPVEQPALVGEGLPQCVRQCGMRLVFGAARIGVRVGCPMPAG